MHGTLKCYTFPRATEAYWDWLVQFAVQQLFTEDLEYPGPHPSTREVRRLVNKWGGGLFTWVSLTFSLGEGGSKMLGRKSTDVKVESFKADPTWSQSRYWPSPSLKHGTDEMPPALSLCGEASMGWRMESVWPMGGVEWWSAATFIPSTKKS